MKLGKILVASILGLAVISCSNDGVKTKNSLDSEMDSLSYALGVNIAQTLKSPNFEGLDYDVLLQGFNNRKDSTNLLMGTDDAMKVIRTIMQKRQAVQREKQLEEQKKKAEIEFAEYKVENEKFLEDNKTKKGVQTTASGLQYIILKEGKGESPKATSKVKVHYTGTTIDGNVFDSSVERGQPADFPVGAVIKGWTEGLQLMKPGAKYKFFIPQELAYGATPRPGGKIKPFATLIFEVELLEVKDK